MNKIATIILIGMLSQMALAQPSDKEAHKEKMEAARIGMITNKLNLDSKQAQLFWPVYNEYRNEKDAFRKVHKELKKTEMTTDTEYLKSIDKMLKVREDELNLEKSYKDKFLKVITPRQLVALFKAEREFKMMLLHKLEGRKNPHSPKDGKPPRGPHPPH